jgi:hypothetical protein
MVSQNKFSSLGMILGVIALITGLVHFSMGPFSSPPPTLENVIAEKVSAVKKGIMAGLKGETVAVSETQKKAIDIEGSRYSGYRDGRRGATLRIYWRYAQREPLGICGALCFGGGTLAFHALLFGIGIVLGILLLLAIIAFLTGSSPF